MQVEFGGWESKYITQSTSASCSCAYIPHVDVERARSKQTNHDTLLLIKMGNV